MAVVRRKKPRAAPRLLRVFFVVLACLFAAVLLKKMDAFSQHHNHKPLNKQAIPRYISPDSIASQQQQLRRVSVQEQAVEQQAAPVREEEEEEEEQDDNDKSQQRRRVEFTLSNLKDGETDNIVVEIVSEWAPLGVERFWKLVDAGFYEQTRFFRVVPKFVAQFGISGNPEVQKEWRGRTISDDPVVQSNQRGTLTYAMSGKNSRTTQLFFNFKDNNYLDKQGFAPIGRIVGGMDVLERIVDAHHEEPKQGQLAQRGNAYLDGEFPDLTYISAVKVLEDDEDEAVG